ncbi:MAG: recombination mediator RecR [Candidatus Krumholzibacteria bacterium]|nr:recombination mediator RecR [Candidatus Krumholzibacteria bacterium]
MNYGLPLLKALVEHFKKLPGIGEKTARRLAFSILDMDGAEVREFAETLLQVKKSIGFCTRCGNLAEGELCEICKDERRNGTILCVVERPADLYVLDASGQYRGRYHVLHGVLSPLDGVGPKDLNLERLERRVREEGIQEVIIATNPSIEGDTTSLYIARILKKLGVKVTRPARGLPLGSSLEYVDRGTITRALENREPI